MGSEQSRANNHNLIFFHDKHAQTRLSYIRSLRSQNVSEAITAPLAGLRDKEWLKRSTSERWLTKLFVEAASPIPQPFLYVPWLEQPQVFESHRQYLHSSLLTRATAILPQRIMSPNSVAAEQALNCIIDDSALVAGVRNDSGNNFKHWINSGLINVYLPLYSKSPKSMM